jgi:hypothetical protein
VRLEFSKLMRVSKHFSIVQCVKPLPKSTSKNVQSESNKCQALSPSQSDKKCGESQSVSSLSRPSSQQLVSRSPSELSSSNAISSQPSVVLRYSQFVGQTVDSSIVSRRPVKRNQTNSQHSSQRGQNSNKS